jgi:hypothetical protein
MISLLGEPVLLIRWVGSARVCAYKLDSARGLERGSQARMCRTGMTL